MHWRESLLTLHFLRKKLIMCGGSGNADCAYTHNVTNYPLNMHQALCLHPLLLCDPRAAPAGRLGRGGTT